MRPIVSVVIVTLAAAAVSGPAPAASTPVPHSLRGCRHRNVSAAGGGIPGVWHIWIEANGVAACEPSAQKCGRYQDFSRTSA